MSRRAERRCLHYGIVSLYSIFYLLAFYSPVYQPTTATQIKKMVQGWEVNVSRNISQYILPENVTTIINTNNLCPTDLFLIVIVCSAPANFEQRSAIRDTWASLADNSVRVAFLLGESNNSFLQKQVQEESGIYNDIIQEKFVDTYNNLTIKSVMMLKWVQQNCFSARFLMKSDDDIYLNLPALSKSLKQDTKRKDILIGSLICKAKPIQDSNNKWYTPQYIFNERYFPKYLSGTGYVLSISVVPKLYKAALNTPIIHLEDIYITGICARKAGVIPLNHNGFSYKKRKQFDLCSPMVFTSHRMSPDDLRTVFSHIKGCSTPTSIPLTGNTPHSNLATMYASYSRTKQLPIATLHPK